MKRYRNAKYLAWVRSLPCSLCGGEAGQAHHLIGLGGMSGMGLKAPDWATLPVCGGCHGSMHVNHELWPSQWEHICRTLGKAVEEGVL